MKSTSVRQQPQLLTSLRAKCLRRRSSCVFAILLLLSGMSELAYAKDYYDVLGVTRDADASTIKRAFRKLAVKYHPDKNPGDKSAEKMYVELNNAYEVLSNEGKRQKYDMFGEDGLKGDNSDGDDDSFDPFGGMFGFGGRRRRQQQERKVPTLVIPLSLSLETLYNGGVIEAVHKRRVICHSWSDCESTCKRCGGRGVVIQTRRIGPGFVQQMQVACPTCGGKGKVGTGKCTSCPHGQFEQVEKTLLIDIEKGMRDGDHITFEGQTDEIPDHVNGDVKFEIVGRPHDRFERSGNDLHYKLTISLTEALVGINRQVRQLDGRLVDIKTDKVVRPGEEIVIEGEGMPSDESHSEGHMIVQITVDFPSKLSDAQKKAVIELFGVAPTLEETGDGTTATLSTPDKDEL